MPSLIYLDYAATTPMDPAVAEVLAAHLTIDGCFANPASRSHMLGWQAEAAVEKARKQVAELIGADTREIVWTSGATEANNLAIKGYLAQFNQTGGHIITSATEHKAVLDCFEFMAQSGFEVSYVAPDNMGRVTPALVEPLISEDTRLLSVMHVNNETGVINDIAGLAELAHSRGLVFHVDAAQSVGKLAIDLAKTPIDLLSMCAHKIYGPKGIGALYVRRREGLSVAPLIHGGGHERGMRSGTLATHQIAAMGESFAIAGTLMEAEQAKMAQFRADFLAELTGDSRITINGDQACCVPGIVNFAVSGVDGQLLMSALPQLAISSGSACTSASMSASHVLIAMGVSEEMALGALRVSFGRFSSAKELSEAARSIKDVLARIS
jgi:cysteine desulfurase